MLFKIILVGKKILKRFLQNVSRKTCAKIFDGRHLSSEKLTLNIMMRHLHINLVASNSRDVLQMPPLDFFAMRK
jgi:hypothetical protein